MKCQADGHEQPYEWADSEPTAHLWILASWEGGSGVLHSCFLMGCGSKERTREPNPLPVLNISSMFEVTMCLLPEGPHDMVKGHTKNEGVPGGSELPGAPPSLGW